MKISCLLGKHKLISIEKKDHDTDSWWPAIYEHEYCEYCGETFEAEHLEWDGTDGY